MSPWDLLADVIVAAQSCCPNQAESYIGHLGEPNRLVEE